MRLQNSLRVIGIALAFLTLSATFVSARCIVTIGLEENEIRELVVQAHRQKLVPREDWDPDNSLFGDDGPFDKISVSSYPVSDAGAIACQKRQLLLIEKIEEALAKTATDLRVAGTLSLGRLIEQVLEDYGSFEDGPPPAGRKLLVGAAIYCISPPSISVVDLTPLAEEIVSTLSGDAESHLAALAESRRVAQLLC